MPQNRIWHVIKYCMYDIIYASLHTTLMDSSQIFQYFETKYRTGIKTDTRVAVSVSVR